MSSASSEFGKDFGLIHEAVVTGRKVGFSREHWAKIAHDEEFFRKVLELVNAKPTCKIIVDSTISFDRDMTKQGWTLNKDAEVVDGEVILELVSFLHKGESCSGNEMIKKAQEKDVILGQRYAEAVLRNQDKIPKEWREYILVFPGTVWCNSLGRLSVPSLRWRGDHWCLDFLWLVYDFNSHCRFVRSRK